MSHESDKDWYYLDLHIHTPASNDFKPIKQKNDLTNFIFSLHSSYSKSDQEYSESLDDKSIKIIAITDHNNVDGFKAIMTRKRETSDLIRKLNERDENIEYTKTLKKEEGLFSRTHILMGVEIKPDPGVHLLVIFDEQISAEQVEEFLQEGIDSDRQFKGNPDTMLKWNISQTFEQITNRFGKKAFVIAPHVDSSAGLYEALKNFSQPRMLAFRNPLLRAVSFNNPETRERLSKLLQDPNYKRSIPLAFIQDSDYHGETEYSTGVMHTRIFLENKKILFTSIQESLSKEKCIKCSIDFVEETYKELTQGFSVKSFNSYSKDELRFSEDDHRLLCDTVCAYLNSDGGIIEIIGNLLVGDNQQTVANTLKDHLTQILSSRLKPISNFRSVMLKLLQFSKGKIKGLILFGQATRLYASEGRFLILKNNDPCPADQTKLSTLFPEIFT